MKRSLLVAFALLSAVAPAAAQGTQADYDRALGLRKKYEALVGSVAETPRWVGRTHKLYYRRTVKGGHDFILVDADTKAKGPAFDHAAIARSLSTATGKTYTALDLPFNAFDFVDGDRAIQFVAESDTWRCDIAASTCRKVRMRCAQSARISITLPSECAQENGKVTSPTTNCTHRMSRITMSVGWLV